MSLPDRFTYHFFPVGQGLFAEGSIDKSNENEPRFLWVYDCGSSSSENLIDDGIRVLEVRAGSRRRIDLLVLSHFDHDHISGVCELIREFEIGTLMLPYVPLARRLVIAFSEGVDRYDEQAPFYLNPVSFFLSQPGQAIERILFVLPSGEEGPSSTQFLLGTSPVDPTDGGEKPDISFPPSKPDDPEELEPLVDATVAAGMRTNVQFIRNGQPIHVGSLWEFVPYNDDAKEEIGDTFLKKVGDERDRLLGANRHKRTNSIKRLKKVYDNQFGNSSVERNVISLFLYSGPIYPTWLEATLHRARRSLRTMPAVPLTYSPLFTVGDWRPRPHQCSIIYTGDGYLDTPERLGRLLTHLTQDRIEHTGVFQVMHHGAQANWHPGIAAAIDPSFSVFSSDPDRKKWGHPHPPVLRDFWQYGPVQVDKQSGFICTGALVPRHP